MRSHTHTYTYTESVQKLFHTSVVHLARQWHKSCMAESIRHLAMCVCVCQQRSLYMATGKQPSSETMSMILLRGAFELNESCRHTARSALMDFHARTNDFERASSIPTHTHTSTHTLAQKHTHAGEVLGFKKIVYILQHICIYKCW